MFNFLRKNKEYLISYVAFDEYELHHFSCVNATYIKTPNFEDLKKLTETLKQNGKYKEVVILSISEIGR